MQIHQAHYAYNTDTGAQIISSTNIPFEYCNINSTQYSIFLSNSTKNLKFLCPRFKDYFIRSNYNSDNFEVIEINFNKWTGSAWKTNAEIESVFSTHYLEVWTISTYFDFNNYDNPVQYLTQMDWILILFNCNIAAKTKFYSEIKFKLFEQIAHQMCTSKTIILILFLFINEL